MKKIKSVFIAENGMVVVRDENGQQIPELQKSCISLWAENAVKQGYDPEGVTVEMEFMRSKIVKNSDGTWNTQLV